MRKIVLLIGSLLLLLCGCERSAQTDAVLFCRAFNRTAPTLRITEQDVCKRSDTEFVIPVQSVLLRLKTNENAAIETVIVSARHEDTALLTEAARTAFTVLAQSFGEQVPEIPDDLLHSAEPTVQQIETKQFVYLFYADREGVTVQQCCSYLLPAQPALRP